MSNKHIRATDPLLIRFGLRGHQWVSGVKTFAVLNLDKLLIYFGKLNTGISMIVVPSQNVSEPSAYRLKKYIRITNTSFSVVSIHMLEIHTIKIVIKSTLKTILLLLVVWDFSFLVIFHT